VYSDDQLQPQVSWGNRVALLDYEIVDNSTDSLDIALQWQALDRMETSYKYFAHLRDAGSGDIISQVDGIPRNWSYPTSWWERGEIITDTISLPLSEVGPGGYEIWLGLYQEVTV
jgi:hypothetical protein